MVLVQCPECAKQVSDLAAACPHCGCPRAVTGQVGGGAGGPAPVSLQTGSFWLCASCGKRVSTHQSSCVCGAVRPEKATAAVVRTRPTATKPPQVSVPEDPRSSAPGKLIAAAFLGGLVLAGALYVSMSKEPPNEMAAARATPPETPRDAETYLGVLKVAQPPVAPNTASPSPIPLTPAEQVALAAEGARLDKTQAGAQAPPHQGAATSSLFPEEDEAKRRQNQEAVQRPAQVVVPQAEQVDPMKTEGYWRARMLESRQKIRAAYDQCKSQYLLGGTGDVGNTTYAGARAMLVNALFGQVTLEEDARRAGASQGWVRMDYSPYRRETLRESVALTGSLRTTVHPCSVPEILESAELRR